MRGLVAGFVVAGFVAATGCGGGATGMPDAGAADLSGRTGGDLGTNDLAGCTKGSVPGPMNTTYSCGCEGSPCCYTTDNKTSCAAGGCFFSSGSPTGLMCGACGGLGEPCCVETGCQAGACTKNGDGTSTCK